MGQMRFRLKDPERISQESLRQIYIAGPEDVPWATQVRWDGSELVVGLRVSDSGAVYVPWTIQGHGRYLLGTSTLIQRQKPYLLEVELARGFVQRLRSQLTQWESLGLETPEELKQELQEVTRFFSRSVTRQDDLSVASEAAGRALSGGMDVADELVACYARQSIAARQRQSSISTLLGTTLGPKTPAVEMRRQLVDACNLIQLPIAWRDIESREGRRRWKHTDQQLGWCQAAGLKVSVGPLLRMDDRGVPDWMVLWEGDFDNLMRLMLDHVRMVVSRYAGRVHLWHVASRVNNGKLLSLDEEQRLQLVASALQLTRQIDSRTPMVVSFDQPWGEYLADQEQDLAPLHYADALVRADLGISGFGLEINAGHHPGGTPHRPTIEYGRLLDQWGAMGLPLMAILSTSSRGDHAPDTTSKYPIEGCDDSPRQTHATSVPERGPEEDAAKGVGADMCLQQPWAASLIPLLLARTSVQVVLWNQLSDNGPHEFPHSGLFDAQDCPKPLLQTLRQFHKNYLM